MEKHTNEKATQGEKHTRTSTSRRRQERSTWAIDGNTEQRGAGEQQGRWVSGKKKNKKKRKTERKG